MTYDVEPVAWMAKHNNQPVQATVTREQAASWIKAGGEVEPLYDAQSLWNACARAEELQRMKNHEHAKQCVIAATAECSEHWRAKLAVLNSALQWIEGATASTPGLTDAELGRAMAAIGKKCRDALGPSA